MDLLLAPFVVATSLLTVAGAQKVLDPRNAVGAIRALGLPASDAGVRAGSALEVAIGVGALATGSSVAVVLVVASYLAFAVFVEAARRHGTMIGTCGCFGHDETPPSFVHVVADLACAGVAVGWLAIGDGAPLDVLADTPWAGVPLAGLCALALWLLYEVMTDLPRALAAARAVAR